MTEKIHVKELDFFYGSYQALKRINLTIHKNALTTFMGPSGGGKSTLLRTFNKIYNLYPSYKAHGTILLDGVNILEQKDDLALRKKVGMVFQKPTPFPMSIHDNIAFGIKLYEKLDKAHLEERIEMALRNAALWEEVKDKLKKDSSQLSLGQQQRLCLARTLAIRPEIILLDEPTSSLDPQSTGLIEDLILKLKKDYTVVLVTHSLAQAKRVSDYVAFIHQGTLSAFGNFSEVLKASSFLSNDDMALI